MDIIIDTRELDIIKLLENKNIYFKKEQLLVGDIIYKKNDEIIYIIERKTINDLGASIKDGRYKEQKARLLSHYDATKVFYLLEGYIDRSKNLDKKSVLGSMINILFRDNIKIINTVNLIQTVDVIEQIKTKYMAGKFIEGASVGNYTDTIKLNKKENMTKELCNIIQLATIPGVSKTTGTTIMENYKTLQHLIEEYKINGELMLKDLVLGKKKLGKVLSKRIYEYLL
tara:strand:+ start:41 stop:724 length:684 start_codon:yes stop_codon:yes gene_type:complete